MWKSGIGPGEERRIEFGTLELRNGSGVFDWIVRRTGDTDNSVYLCIRQIPAVFSRVPAFQINSSKRES
jgi:hypothetical protein